MEINENDPQDVRAFVLSKNLSKIAKLDTLIQWERTTISDKAFSQEIEDTY